MTDIQEASAIRAPAVSWDTGRITTAVRQIDESFFGHVATDNWVWREIIESDQAAPIGQHTDFVLTELKFSLEPRQRSPCLITCQQNGKQQAAAILVPKSIAGDDRIGPAWDLKGYRLAGNRLTRTGLIDRVRQWTRRGMSRSQRARTVWYTPEVSQWV